MSDLSTRVRLRREQLGLSQEELARRMGYRSRSSITKLEKGINDLPQSKVEELAQALETTPAALLGSLGLAAWERRSAGAGRALRLSPGL